jgi:UDP-glucose 4-epimerase
MRVLITGGTGTIGTALRQTKSDDVCLSVLSRCEHRQVPIRDVVDCHIGDVADKAAVRRAMGRSDPSVVIHAAAIKHVSTGELDPLAAIRNNVVGTANVVDAAKEVGARVLLISTDKAVHPTTAYGASKMLAERIVRDSGRCDSRSLAPLAFGGRPTMRRALCGAV